MNNKLLKRYRNLLSREAILVMEIEIHERNEDHDKVDQLKQQKSLITHDRLLTKSLLNQKGA